jgi:hypothetical protein
MNPGMAILVAAKKRDGEGKSYASTEGSLSARMVADLSEDLISLWRAMKPGSLEDWLSRFTAAKAFYMPAVVEEVVVEEVLDGGSNETPSSTARRFSFSTDGGSPMSPRQAPYNLAKPDLEELERVVGPTIAKSYQRLTTEFQSFVRGKDNTSQALAQDVKRLAKGFQNFTSSFGSPSPRSARLQVPGRSLFVMVEDLQDVVDELQEDGKGGPTDAQFKDLGTTVDANQALVRNIKNTSRLHTQEFERFNSIFKKMGPEFNKLKRRLKEMANKSSEASSRAREQLVSEVVKRMDERKRKTGKRKSTNFSRGMSSDSDESMSETGAFKNFGFVTDDESEDDDSTKKGNRQRPQAGIAARLRAVEVSLKNIESTTTFLELPYNFILQMQPAE